MDRRELDMYKLQEIIESLLAGEPIKRIARKSRISKNTVKKYKMNLDEILEISPEIKNDINQIMKEFHRLRQDEKHSENFGWLLKNSELVNELGSKCDNLVRLNEVLHDKGFRGSYSSLVRFMNKHTELSTSPVMRIETKAGEIAQVDFGYAGKIYDDETGEPVKAYIFAMVLGFSRDAFFEIVTGQDVTTWINCHIHAFEHFGGVLKIVVPDNLKSAIIKASFIDPTANRSYADLADYYGFQIDPCLPATPQHKGKVESGVKYVKNNFLPLRTFRNITDANRQLSEWNKNIARERIHGTTRRKPSDLFEIYEKPALKRLPILRFEISVWKQLKVYRDTHIQFDKAYYSVPCELRGEHVWARKTSSQIAIFHENALVSVHFPLKPGQRSTKKEHYPEDKFRYMEWDTDYCTRQAAKIGDATLYLVNRLLKEEPIRNLRAAQNILRLEKKFGRDRLEPAARCAVSFNNFTYGAVKTILERNLNTELRDDEEKHGKNLDSSYARNLAELLN